MDVAPWWYKCTRWDGMDNRVNWGIEHLTVLIRNDNKYQSCRFSGYRFLIVSDAAAAQHCHGDGHQCSHGWTVEGGKGEILEKVQTREINKIFSCWIVVWCAKTEKLWPAGRCWRHTAVCWHQQWQEKLQMIMSRKCFCRKLLSTSYLLFSLSCMGYKLIRLISSVPINYSRIYLRIGQMT